MHNLLFLSFSEPGEWGMGFLAPGRTAGMFRFPRLGELWGIYLSPGTE